MDRDAKQMMLRQTQALNRIADAAENLNRTMTKINTNLAQIGQNMKEDRAHGGTSNDE